ncbi:MAG: hypothetical protein ACNS60_19015 [Candidatus Cyclobacteriaceae bacterium M2_1C_046]
MAQRKSQNERDETYYRYKIESFHKMQRVGIMMGVSGGAMTILGATVISAANNNTEMDGSDRTTLGAFGVASIIVGVPLGITGIVIGTIGSRKLKETKERLNELKLESYADPNVQGLVLKYKF